jgi:fatty acid desaturase
MELNVSSKDASRTASVPGATAPALTPSNAIGARLLIQVTLATTLGIGLSASAAVGVWLLGQLLLGVALLQWFVLLHESGHHTLFRTRALNAAAGHIAGLFALIPYASWRRVHGLHHVWTGWQDLDPTTAGLAPRARSALELRITDVAWRCWIPLFAVVYRLSNYWNLWRLKRLFQAGAQQRAIVVNVTLLGAVYGAVLWMLGPADALRFFALALLFGLALQDPLILSQHTHIPQRLSEGRKVAPLSGSEQEPYTRSLRFPPGFHAGSYSGLRPTITSSLAGRSRLSVVFYSTVARNSVDWWLWLSAAKRLRLGAVVSNRASSGFPW